MCKKMNSLARHYAEMEKKAAEKRGEYMTDAEYICRMEAYKRGYSDAVFQARCVVIGSDDKDVLSGIEALRK